MGEGVARLDHRETTLDEGHLVAEWRCAQAALRERRFDVARGIIREIELPLFDSCEIEQHGSSPGESPEAAIVVLSHRDNELITEALKRIRAQIDPHFELILVENGNPLLRSRAEAHFEHFKVVVPPIPLGCSIGRNFGARVTSARHVIFLDDDGLIEPGALDAMMAAKAETNAAMIRGRIFPLTQSRENLPRNYDLGTMRRPSLLNAEGISLVRRDVFLEFGGFDPLLAGHEGVELSARMWRHLGPYAFLYEPGAVLLHDYAKDSSHASEKAERFSLMRDYAAYRTPEVFKLHRKVADSAASILPYYVNPQAKATAPVSVVTTARNARQFLGDYTTSLRRQTHSHFEVIFVDDGSEDGTADEIERLWQGDDRLNLIRSTPGGRAAALNLAFDSAQYPVSVIADVDDISAPQRLAWSAAIFEADARLEFVSFATFNEAELLRSPSRPTNPIATDLGSRLLLGMAGQFPAYAFRTSAVTARCDVQLGAGIDYDWLVSNLLQRGGMVGRLIPFPIVYYRQHDGQISSSRSLEQSSVRRNGSLRLFRALLGDLLPEDLNFIDALLGNKDLPPDEEFRFPEWTARVLASNARVKLFEPISLSYVLSTGRERHCVRHALGGDLVIQGKALRAQIVALRRAASAASRIGEHRLARHILRGLNPSQELRSLRLQMLAASKPSFIRSLFSFYRYDD